MHDTAYELARIFFRTYARAGDPILEIGSMDVNGSMRDFRPASGHYVGVDLSPGKGVDVVTDSAARLPFKSGAFQLVVSSSAFEHDAMFWMTFLEMCRMLQPGGYIYINAPSRGYLHSYPIDAWRFFPDAGLALRDWARTNNQDLELLESFITANRGDVWNDCVMVFTKGGQRPPLLICEQYPLALNIRVWPDLGTIRQRRDNW